VWTRACAAGLHGVLVAAQRHGPPPVRCGGSEPRGRGPRGPSGGVVAVAGSCACGRGCVRSPVACSLARGRVLCQTRSKFWCSLHAQHQRRKPLQPTRAVRARARAQPPGMCTPLGRSDRRRCRRVSRPSALRSTARGCPSRATACQDSPGLAAARPPAHGATAPLLCSSPARLPLAAYDQKAAAHDALSDRLETGGGALLALASTPVAVRTARTAWASRRGAWRAWGACEVAPSGADLRGTAHGGRS